MKIKQKITYIFIGVAIVLGGLVTVAPIVKADCGGVSTNIINCDETNDGTVEGSGLWGVLLLVINILTAGVGIAAVGGLIYGSILYTSAGGTPEGVKKAHTIIQNVVIGIVMYALLYSLLNFLIPGGIFN